MNSTFGRDASEPRVSKLPPVSQLNAPEPHVVELHNIKHADPQKAIKIGSRFIIWLPLDYAIA